MQLARRVLSIVLVLLMLLPLVFRSGIATASSGEDIQKRCEELQNILDTGNIKDYDSILKEYKDIKADFANADEETKQNEYIRVGINNIEDKISLFGCNEVVNGTNKILNDYNSGLYENKDKLNNDIQRIFEISKNIIIKHSKEFAIEGYLDRLRALTEADINEIVTDEDRYDRTQMSRFVAMVNYLEMFKQQVLKAETATGTATGTYYANKWLWLNLYGKTEKQYSSLQKLEVQNEDVIRSRRQLDTYFNDRVNSNELTLVEHFMMQDYFMLTALFDANKGLPSEPASNSLGFNIITQELNSEGDMCVVPRLMQLNMSQFTPQYALGMGIEYTVDNLFYLGQLRKFGVYAWGESVNHPENFCIKKWVYSNRADQGKRGQLINPNIFRDPEFIKSPNDLGVWGLYDATGVKTKQYLNLTDDDWNNALLNAVKGAHARSKISSIGKIKPLGEDTLLFDLSDQEIIDKYELIPYVIKHQTVEIAEKETVLPTGDKVAKGQILVQGGWHIDCYIRRKNVDSLNPSLVTVSYILNLPTGIKITDPIVGLPSGDIGNPGFSYTAKPLYMNNQSTSEEPLRWIDAVYTYKDIHGETKNEEVKLAFAGYVKESSGPENDNGAYIHSGQPLKINYDTVLAAQWRQIPNFNITYLGLEGSNFEESNPNPTEYGLATPIFSLKSPEKPGYIFVGWTGGVIDKDIQSFPDIRITSPTINVKVNDTGKGGDRVYEAHFIEDRGQKTESEKTIHQGTIQNNWITENNKSDTYVYTQTPSTPDRATISKNDITKENDESMKYNYVISSRLLTKLNPGDKYAVYDKVEDGTDSRYSGRVDSIIPDNSSMLGDIRIYVKTETLGTTENTETDSSSSKDESAEDIETGNGEDYSEEIAGSEQAPDEDTSGEIEDNTGEDIEEDSDTGNEANPEETTDNNTYDFDRVTNDTDNNLLNVFDSSNSEWKVYNENKLNQVLESKRITEVLIVYDIASELAEDIYIRTGINMTHRGNTQLTGDSQTMINNSTIVVSKDTHHVEITNTTRLETYKDATVAILPKAGGTGVRLIIGTGLGLVVISLATLFIIKKKPKKLF